MNAFEVLRLLDPEVEAERLKIHLATWNGREDPLDVYLRGEFEGWQATQSQLNFQRDFVLALIAFRRTERWLFAGLYETNGFDEVKGPLPYRYHLEERAATRGLNGRLVVHFRRPGRNSYLNAERWVDGLVLHEIRSERLAIADFPGYRNVSITHADLRLIVRQVLPSWKAALSSVAGVYLISDAASGRLYVGSACGAGGLWARWSQYAQTGHGGNVELRQLLRDAEASRPDAFRYSILEIVDLHASEDDVLSREAHWKTVLMTREHGLNAN